MDALERHEHWLNYLQNEVEYLKACLPYETKTEKRLITETDKKETFNKSDLVQRLQVEVRHLRKEVSTLEVKTPQKSKYD